MIRAAYPDANAQVPAGAQTLPFRRGPAPHMFGGAGDSAFDTVRPSLTGP